MYSASQAFHTAVANGAHQIALLIFDDAVFTNDDIDVSRGIEFNDYFNTEEDLSIGQALSNEISFSLFNDSGLLNDYEFGTFTATIGAQIGNEVVTAQGAVQVNSGSHTYVAYASSPYLKRDGTNVSSQPASAVTSMLVYNGTVYCLLGNGTVKAYNDSDGSVKNVTLNDFMKAQLAKWAGKGIAYTKASGENWKLRIWKGTNKRTYEFVPLGVFHAERPNVPTVIEIDFTCYDLMQNFEKDMPTEEELASAVPGFSYPCTFMELFEVLCTYAEVPYIDDPFINSTAVLNSAPEDFDRATMRDVIGWLAEAAGSNARINREGNLIMDWVHTGTGQIYDEHSYSEFRPYWYETATVEKLTNRASSGDYDYSRGSGEETYLIQDNPLLKGVE